MQLLLDMLRDEPNAVIGSVGAALAAAALLMHDLRCDEASIARARRVREP